MAPSALPPTIRLWDHAGLGLIVSWPSGVRYSNQTGGSACLQPELEGVFLPLRNDVEVPSGRFVSPEDDLMDHFQRVYGNAGATYGLSDADADVIDAVLAQRNLSAWIAVDRTRLSDSHEAWVHVTVGDEVVSMPEHQRRAGGTALQLGLGPYPRPGVLTWTSSD